MSTPDHQDASLTPEESPDRTVHPNSDHDDEEEEDDDEDEDMAAEQKSESRSGPASPAAHPKKKKPATSSSVKDPTRPRRRKARRACQHCQRAHLTCGESPFPFHQPLMAETLTYTCLRRRKALQQMRTAQPRAHLCGRHAQDSKVSSGCP